MEFGELGLIAPLLDAVHAEGYLRPTPIQQQTIPPILEGRDILGCAQTGTGKTAAFALPILQLLATTSRGANPVGSGRRPIRVLVLTPTRELATQIGESFNVYGRLISQHRVGGQPLKALRQTVIFGGVGQRPQEQVLRAGVDILVATPGRLLDLAGQGIVKLDRVEIFVLDEADRMLDMGFLNDVRKVIAMIPEKRQTLFFSATMPGDIRKLADQILCDPRRVAVTPMVSTVDTVEQFLYLVEKSDKRALLEHLLASQKIVRALIFTRTKHGANRLVEQLVHAGYVAQAIHGNKSQRAREQALLGFKRGTTPILVATDIAARGIDIDEISHVINYEIPNIPETYVHRIGRTARAGAAGIALSLCDQEERAFLDDIEKLIRQHIPLVEDHPFPSALAPKMRPRPAPAPPKQPSSRHHSSRSSASENHGAQHRRGAVRKPSGPARTTHR